MFIFNPEIMKKHIFIKTMLFLVTLATGTVQGFSQHRIVEAQYPSAVQHTIVREYTYPSMVSYVETATAHYFAYADATMTILNAEIDPNIYVKDFVIFEDYVYFCGLDNSQQTAKGVWGWFKIPDLVSSSMSYYIHNDFHCNLQYADTLHSLVAFRDSTSALHIAVVGSVSDGSMSNQSCMLDITGTVGSAGWNYTMGITTMVSPDYEKLTKVCLTDNFVVAVGSVLPGYGNVNHRFHRRNDMFQLGGPQDFFYKIPGDFWPQPWDYAVTHLYSDFFAVAVKHEANSLSFKGIMVYVFYIPAVTTGVNAVYSAHVQTVAFTDLLDICDIRYSQTYRELTLLLNGTTPWGVGSLVAELQLAAPTMPIYQLSFLPDRMMTSLDNYNAQQHFLAMGYNLTNPTEVDFSIQPLLTNPECSVKQYIGTSDVNYAVKVDTIPYNTCADKINCDKRDVEKYKIIDLAVSCSD